MAAVLFALDGNPQPQWNVRIQPNSLISILSTVSSCAFMSAVTQCISQSKWLHFQKGGRVIDLQRFDQASRGAWGSLQFLGRLGFRNTIAIAGSLITIASLAMDPFTQQIIEFPVRQKSLGTGSSLASAARGEGMVSGLYTNGFGNGAVAESAPDWQEAIQGIVGALYMGMFGQLPSQPYACSTGNCSYPVINTLGVCSTCLNVTSQSTMDHCAFGNDTNNPTETCYVETPGGFNLSVEKGIVSATRTYNTLLSAAANQSNIALPDIMSFAMYRSAADSFYSSTTLGPDSQTYECSLRFCERSYADLQVINGTANNPEQTATNFSTSSSPGDGNYVLFPSNAEPNLTYWLAYNDWYFLSTQLQSMFTVSMQSAYGSSAYNMIATLLWTERNDVSQVFSNMSESMTRYIRTANATNIPGEAYHEEVYVHVRWAWFAFPATLATMAAMLQLVTIFVNKSEGLKAWKDSALPFVVPEPEDQCEMEGVAKVLRLKLEITETGKYALVLSH
ncbi:hypothetical protein VP1G_03708 [Cytospora mali]|uniref:Uncharacterized protein n=1 Tax=Cytospora mali TaxID=578113 RepID=A0A194UXN3_CYTMA|nr:hypothetical protein VP1G_03708 [Valsa mali var. pyri (nom. inval.)]